MRTRKNCCKRKKWWNTNKKTVRGPWEGGTLSHKYRNWSDVYRCRLLLVAHEALGYAKRTDGPQCYFARFKEFQASARPLRRHGALGDGGALGGGGDHGGGGDRGGGHGGGHGGGDRGGDHGESEDSDDVSLSDASETSLENPWEPPAHYPDRSDAKARQEATGHWQMIHSWDPAKGVMDQELVYFKDSELAALAKSSWD